MLRRIDIFIVRNGLLSEIRVHHILLNALQKLIRLQKTINALVFIMELIYTIPLTENPQFIHQPALQSCTDIQLRNTTQDAKLRHFRINEFVKKSILHVCAIGSMHL